MSNRISTTQQKVDREKFSEGYDAIPEWNGWKPFDSKNKPEGEDYVVDTFNNKRYWKPIDEAINDLTDNAGAIK